jgi:hypothetical protein
MNKRELHRELDALREASARSAHALYCLAYKLNPQGFVDISEEEWNGVEKMEIKVILQDGGARVLAR